MTFYPPRLRLVCLDSTLGLDIFLVPHLHMHFKENYDEYAVF